MVASFKRMSIVLLDPLTEARFLRGHRHLLRDWSGAYLPGFIPLPPLDLMCTAALLRKHGHRVDVIEASVHHYSNKKVVELLASRQPDFVLIPSTFFSLSDDKALAALIRRSCHGVKVIFAGPLVTSDPALVLNDGAADFVALGEFESPLLGIMRGEYAQNIAYQDRGRLICGERTLMDLAEIPLPARDLFSNHHYKYAIFNRGGTVAAMTISRGCPHSKCIFCHSKLFSLGQIRYRDIGSIKEEVNDIVCRYKIGEIFFRDQTFTSNRSLVMALCDYLVTENIKIPWRATTRVDFVDLELLRRMKQAGCYQLTFGFESCTQTVLDKIEKGIRVEQSKAAVRMCKEVGIEVLGLFMFGLPGDTSQTMDDLVNFILELDVDYAQVNGVYFVPGTFLYEKFSRKMLPSSRVASCYILLAYLRFYFRPKYILRLLRKVSSVRDLIFLIKMGFNVIFQGF